MMKFKSELVEHEFKNTSKLLQYMAQDMDEFVQREVGQEIIITRVLESIVGDSGVHEANRAFDVRDEFDGGRLYSEEQVKKIVQFMNESYPRNDGKPTCINHSFGGGPHHFHVQIALLTKTYEIGA